MAGKALSKLKYRLSAAIDWRVREEFEKEREFYTGLSTSITDISVSYSDQIMALNEIIEDLDRRVRKLEN
jgi:hypothetical protein